MWHLVAQFSGGLGNAGLTARFNNLKGLYQLNSIKNEELRLQKNTDSSLMLKAFFVL